MEEVVISTYGEIEELGDQIDINFKNFKNFDINQDPPFDHHFYYTNVNTTIKCEENIKKEWEILKTNLPGSSIFVRAYKGRVDLMRVAILGPETSSCCHGLYFLDIQLPQNYPSGLPTIIYNSCGLDINPNEKETDLLQLLLSIQSWVLTANSSYSNWFNLFYLFWGQKEYEKKELMKSYEAILKTLHQPPGDFEDFVRGYFRSRANKILYVFKEKIGLSELNLKKGFVRLIRVFEENKTYCGHHYNEELRQIKKSLEENSLTAYSRYSPTAAVSNFLSRFLSYTSYFYQ